MAKQLSSEQRTYMEKLAETPQTSPEFWPKYLAELYAAGYVQKIGRSIYLTEKGHNVAL